jgi:hypothetical protein
VNIVEYAIAVQDEKLAALKAQALLPAIDSYKFATRAAIKNLGIFTDLEKFRLIREIEDTWAAIEAR